jgi:sugar lactone lactonase YvrE
MGRFYVAAGLNKDSQWESSEEFKGGIYILSPEGKLLEFVHFEKNETTNCTFSGPDRKTLMVTAGNQLWSVPVSTPGRISAMH